MMENVKRFWLLAGAVIAVLVAVGSLALRPYFWSRIWSSRVSLEGVDLPNARLFRSSQESILIDFQGTPEIDHLYVVRTRQAQVAVTTTYYFWSISSIGAFSKDSPDPAINMLHEKNNRIDPHLRLEGNAATFRTLSGKTVRVEWR